MHRGCEVVFVLLTLRATPQSLKRRRVFFVMRTRVEVFLHFMFVIFVYVRDTCCGHKEGCRWYANGERDTACAWCFYVLITCLCSSLLVRPRCTSDKGYDSFQMARQFQHMCNSTQICETMNFHKVEQ